MELPFDPTTIPPLAFCRPKLFFSRFGVIKMTSFLLQQFLEGDCLLGFVTTLPEENKEPFIHITPMEPENALSLCSMHCHGSASLPSGTSAPLRASIHLPKHQEMPSAQSLHLGQAQQRQLCTSLCISDAVPSSISPLQRFLYPNFPFLTKQPTCSWTFLSRSGSRFERLFILELKMDQLSLEASPRTNADT